MLSLHDSTLPRFSVTKPMGGGMRINDLTYQIIKAAMNVHCELGPGLLESVYQLCMVLELRELGLHAASELVLPISYRGRQLAGES